MKFRNNDFSAGGKQFEKFVHNGDYRIVQFDIEHQPWLLIQRLSIVGIPLWWRGVNGADRGAEGQFNYQLEMSGNPIWLMETLRNVAEFSVSGRSCPNYGRDKLPRARIIRELHLPMTLDRLIVYGYSGDDFQEQCKLAVFKYEPTYNHVDGKPLPQKTVLIRG